MDEEEVASGVVTPDEGVRVGDICTYMHAYVNGCIPPYVHTYIHTYMNKQIYLLGDVSA